MALLMDVSAPIVKIGPKNSDKMTYVVGEYV
jgi:hypothetical protein